MSMKILNFPVRLQDILMYLINLDLKLTNHHVRPKSLQWQSGYGVVTFGKKDLAWVIDYVEKQKEHHRLRNTYPRLESISFDG